MPTIFTYTLNMLNRRFLRLKAVKTLYGHFTNEYSVLQIQKKFDNSVQQSFLLYLYLIHLAPSLQHYSWLREEQIKQKQRPTQEELLLNRNLIKNAVATKVSENKPLQEVLKKHGLKWNTNSDNTLKEIYNRWITSDSFKSYVAINNPTFEDDKTVISDLYNNFLPEFSELYNALEEQSIFWDCDEVDFFLSKVHKTYQNITEIDDFAWFPLYKNEEDKNYPQELLKNVVENHDKYIALLKEHTQNWELDRIAQMDFILLLAALAELTGFENIPVKVTLNEYVEIAKFYSTPNSYNFINGILDRCAKDLLQKQLIHKIESVEEEE